MEKDTRVQILASEKAFLTTLNNLYHKLIMVRGLEPILKNILNTFMDILGGQDIEIYYNLKGNWRIFNLKGDHKKVDISHNEQIQKAIETKTVGDYNHVGSEDITFIGFKKSKKIEAHDLIFPIMIHERCIGVLIINGILMHGDRLKTELNTFLSYAAIILNNELENYSELESAYNELEQIFELTPDGMVVLDKTNTVLRINKSLLEMLYLKRSGIIGEKCNETLCHNLCHGDITSCTIRNKLIDKENVEFDVVLEEKGKYRYDCIFKARKLTIGGEFAGVIISIRDITKRKEYEVNIQKSLVEKETLLKEIHHRVKNNLQVIISLLSLQAAKISNERDRSLFIETNNRIMAMAIVHESLYRSRDFSEINFKDYCRRLTAEIVKSYALEEKNDISINLNINEIIFPIDISIPLALIINELIINAVKHAFKVKTKGTIDISITLNCGLYLLEICDNGSGLPENFIPEKTLSLGLNLVQSLTDQIGGTLEYKNHDGLCVQIHFPE